MKKVFYCDFDGIISKSKERLVNLYNLYYRPLDKPIIKAEDVITWDCNIPTHLVDTIFSRYDFFKNLQIHDGVEEGLCMLKERGYEIILYSKGSMKNLGHKILWLEQSDLGEYFDGWILAGAEEIKMKKNQVDMSIPQDDGFSILFDDCYTNLVCDDDDKWKHHMPSYSICGKLSKGKNWDKEEWNIKFTDKSMTARSWNDLGKILDRIENFEINVIR